MIDESRWFEEGYPEDQGPKWVLDPRRRQRKISRFIKDFFCEKDGEFKELGIYCTITIVVEK